MAESLWTRIADHIVGSTQQVIAASPSLGSCPGYVASNVVHSASGLVASLSLAGPPCDTYGNDMLNLTLEVQCQSENRLHVQIHDPNLQIYQIPEPVLPRPQGSIDCTASGMDFAIVEDPFSFKVVRKSNQDVLLDTSNAPLIFQDQYWRLATLLPEEPNLYGMGEHTDTLRLQTTGYVRTLWNRDSADVPEGSNLYGSHPVYFENRIADDGQSSHTHGVVLLNSNGMDVKIDRSSSRGQYLEYNVLGGIIDIYVLSGPSPFDVARQYSEISGKPAMMPWFSFGSHQCRHGYSSVADLEAVVANYSLYGIPLETIWTDIDYMDGYKVFTLDPNKFPLEGMRKFVSRLHENQQHYVVMVDPAVAYQDYRSFNRGINAGIFLLNSSDQVYQGIVWPGLTAYPDWFSENIQAYWTGEFADFFHADKGVDIDSLWIDMNEPSNFCDYPCTDPRAQERAVNRMKVSSATQRPIFPLRPRSSKGSKMGLPGRDLDNPRYKIKNDFGMISSRTANTTLIHENGLAMYDTHNLYGHMMSLVSHAAMIARRQLRRTMVITRSTFIGSGSKVGHWLGDNLSTWDHYRQSIRHLLQFTSIFQIPMVGADICGFGRDSKEQLCARWTRLGAFYPFMRNHNTKGTRAQEYYQWPAVAEAAKKAIDLRYRLLDYLYTHMYLQSLDGTPALAPIWMHYPIDPRASSIDHQFFYGPSFLISPVLEQDRTNVTVFLPDDLFYEFSTFEQVVGAGKFHTISNVNITDIPIHIRAGSIIPMRVSSANTTTQLRTNNLELLVALDAEDQAFGVLYLDDGDSLVQETTSTISFQYRNGVLQMNGSFHFLPARNLLVERTVILSGKGTKNLTLNWPLSGEARVVI